ncbi:MAG: carbohydrate binding family 9 domain-containing protein [Flavobacteriales bacterium]|nr:carbohydrate binding family 9 domain-containing protein [Flavobacteriales bacterium]MBT6175275.1 carbohydrate binding family 9 domain-containing protein [Flavobacteriales bacterium]
MRGRIRLFGYITLAFFFIEDINAQRIANASLKVSEIVLDGKLNEVAWGSAEVISDFTQFSPNPGYESTQRTELRILFDDEAIYVGAQMFDTAPDSILMQYSQRDQIRNSDEFGFMFSPYNDGINGVAFATTPAGILVDMNVSPTGMDSNWDAVWDVMTVVDENGWTAEFEIPWAALRFAKMEEGEEVVWGVNFWRKIRRFREFSVWEPMDATSQVEGMRETGELHGFSEITPPPRITFFPYASVYAESMEDGGLGTRFNGGLDFKAGIGDAFTLDMTLIPDFGQVVADNLVLNLSAYEIQFQDNRPFFTEGTELFNKSGLFYSRRVGENLQLINASKFSGRTKGGLGIGALQAFAIDAQDSTENSPVTSYSVAVLDQSLPNNGYVHGISTLVTKDGESALVQGVDFELRNKKNSYSLSGQASYTDGGHKWKIGTSKISGNFIIDAFHLEESEFYDPNDLGYLQAPNEVVNSLGMEYQIVEPFGRFVNLFSGLEIEHTQLYYPRTFTDLMISGELGAMTKSFQFARLGFYGSPVRGVDFFEPRLDGYSFNLPTWGYTDLIISTDYRKQIAIDVRLARSIAFTEGVDWNGYDFRIEPRLRINDKLSFRYVYSYQGQFSELGYATIMPGLDGEDESIFGARNNKSETHVLSGAYILSNRSGFNIRIRHYWSTVDYLEFYSLGQDSELHETSLVTLASDNTSEYDVNFNAWSVDFGFTWQFSPGSELSIVWKNTLQSRGVQLPSSYFDNWEQMLEETFVNSLSIKALYYLDYNTIRR